MLKSPWLFLAVGGLVIVAVVLVVSLPSRSIAPATVPLEGLSICSLFDDDDAPWDLASIKAMTWEELGAVNIDLDGDGLFRVDQQRYNELLDFSYRQVEYEWGAKNDTYTMLPKGEPPPPDGAYATVDLRHHAFLFLPDDYPDRFLKGYGHAVLYNVHEFPRSKEGGVHLRSDEKFRALRAVQLFGIPVLLHGEDRRNWAQLGYASQDDVMGASGLVTALANSDDPAVLKMFYLYVLLRQNLQAITLTGLALDRIEPRSPPGERIGGGVLCRGSSKQGATCLRIGFVGDDRVKVLIPGRNHLLSDGGVQKYVEDWGFPRTRNHYPWLDDSPPRGDREKLRNTVWSRLALTEWSMAAIDDEPGRTAHKIFSAHNQIDALRHIDLIAFYGQVGRYKSRQWKSDRLDNFAEHDRQFPLGAETAFLDDLDPSQWRYAREKPDHPDSPPRFYTRPDFNWLEAIHQLVEPDRTRWIKIVSAESSLDGTTLTVRADVTVAAPHKDDGARLYFTLSERNRCWNDWEQNGIETPGRPWHPWRSVPMRRLSPLEYEATVDVENSQWSIAWYVEAMHLIDETVTPALKVFDATPPRFERESPIEPQNRGCSDVGAVTIEGCDPNPASGGGRVAVTVAFASRRIPVHPDLGGYFLDVMVNVDLIVDGNLVDTHRMPIEKALDATNRATLYWKVPRDGASGDHTLVVAVDPPVAVGGRPTEAVGGRPTEAVGGRPTETVGGRLAEFDEENNLSAPFVLEVVSR